MCRLFLIFTLCSLVGLPACSHLITPVTPDPDFAASYPEPESEVEAYRGGAIFQVAVANDLFSDRRAYRKGDILTVNLIEQTDAETRSSTTTAKDDSVGLNIDSLFGIAPTVNSLEFGNNFSDGSRNFTGTGNSSQSNSLEGELTVMVAQVLSNGNLVIRGEKIVTINQGAEFIRMAGIVRPEDIAPDNTISSAKVANARVSYGGGGPLAEANTVGWLSRFFSSEYWPF